MRHLSPFPAPRSQARTIVDGLPDDCSYADLLAALQLDHLIEHGLKDSLADETMSTQDLRLEMKAWWKQRG